MPISLELRAWIIVSALLLLWPLAWVIEKLLGLFVTNRSPDQKQPASTDQSSPSLDAIAQLDPVKAHKQTLDQQKTEQQSLVLDLDTIDTDSQSAPTNENTTLTTDETIDATHAGSDETTTLEYQAVKQTDLEEPSEIQKHKSIAKLNKLKKEAKRISTRDPVSYEKKLVEGMALNPDDDEILTMLIDHYFGRKEYKKALSLLKKILEKDITNHKALWQIGEIYINDGDSKTAEMMIEKAIKQSNDNPKYLYSLVGIKYNSNQYDDAIYLLERILKLRPTNVEYLIAAGMIHHELGDKKKARKHFFEVLQHDADNKTAKAMLRDE